MKLIVNADDFGYSEGVNHGIMEAFYHGVVTSATLMVNMPGAGHAFALKQANPSLGVGIHLVLTCGKPLCEDVSSLMNEEGYFQKGKNFLDEAEPEEIRKELTAQFTRFVEQGGLPTHIDSHHHVHAHEKVSPIVIEIAKKYSLPIRMTRPNSEELKKAAILTTDFLAHTFYGEMATRDHLIELLETISEFETAELMCHPGYVDEAVITGSSYNVQRLQELEILKDPSLKQELAKRKIELTHYGSIKG
ncbi:hypothetical protein SAMN05877753_103418 [Bacillus oleivorans]|uniref:Carbohydrate deacetylase n=1 Tax=Bacillus oleivorans TaxID=1448271 RepID=A0A285CRI6_9BACI|nr:chitin disaccharide deacetylase [Bacillus oleivorans]SNX70035.1 hypothetical protein SAMN05877753_103418 [Bacillus oleivorans]